MKAVLALLASCAAALAFSDDDLINSHAFVESVNEAAPWTAGFNSRFDGMTFGQAKFLMGTNTTDNLESVQRLPKYETAGLALPSSFDARTKWPTCAILKHVRDQASCGSCWAVSSTDTFNARLCIATGYDKELSAEVTNSCCNANNAGLLCFGSQGCNGGQPSQAWNFFVDQGIPTGGDYSDVGTGKSCAPYQIPPCYHHEQHDSTDLPECQEGGGTPVCPSKRCTESKYTTSYADDTQVAKQGSVKSLPSVEAMMESLVSEGPITVAFSVYADFLTWTGPEPYVHKTGGYMGGHAVEIIGYGTYTDGTDYWLVKNSWNTGWGEGGFFKIKKGVNECGIEGQAVAGSA